jgi:crotonobetainyl-CoA:carnitine CoA-transferase CaiB-like acyl-CoA transferase
VQTIEEVVKDPQIHARGMLIEQEHPVLGKVTLPSLPFRFSDCDTTVRTPAPLLGQHNRHIAASLGIPAETVDAMVRDGVLYNEAAVQE